MFNKNIILLATMAATAIAAPLVHTVKRDDSNVRFGNAFSLGATTSYIIEATTTLTPGDAQSGQTPRLALWAGMGTDAGDLIQAIILSSTDAQGEDCGGKPHVEGQWCVFASTLQDGVQLQGDTYAITGNQSATVHYLYDETSGNTTQTVSVDGTAVSTLSTASGKSIGWGTAEEAQSDFSGVVNEHTYTNTTIKLAAADSSFSNTLVKTGCTGDLVSSDDITFTVEKIVIEEYSFSS